MTESVVQSFKFTGGLRNTADSTRLSNEELQTCNNLYTKDGYLTKKYSPSNLEISSPTATLKSGTGITAGTHTYRVTFIATVGGAEICAGSPSNAIVHTGTNLQTTLSNIPLQYTAGYTRNIYRNKVGDQNSWFLLTNINDNTTTTYVDSTPDTSLTTALPTALLAYPQYLATTFLDNKKILIEVKSTGVINEALYTTGSSVYSYINLGKTLTTTATTVFDSTQVLDFFFLTNNVEMVQAKGNFGLFTNVSATGFTNGIICAFVKNFGNRLCAINCQDPTGTSKKFRTYYSTTVNYQDFGGVSSTQYFDVPDDGSQGITAAIMFKGSLYLFTTNACHRVDYTGDALLPFKVKQYVANFGCNKHHALLETRGMMIIWTTENQLVAFDGFNVKRLDYNIKDLLANAITDPICTYYHSTLNKFVLQVGSGSFVADIDDLINNCKWEGSNTGADASNIYGSVEILLGTTKKVLLAKQTAQGMASYSQFDGSVASSDAASFTTGISGASDAKTLIKRVTLFTLETNSDTPTFYVYDKAGTQQYSGTFPSTAILGTSIYPNVEVQDYYFSLSTTNSNLTRISRIDIEMEPTRRVM